ncbi:MAG: hypothetical protein ACREQ5_06100 [Candidatus Dormibacteria bacterium]
MPKASSKGTDADNAEGIFLRLDSITLDRVTKQAARKHGTTKGFMQDYARAALMAALERDEASMEQLTKKSSVTERSEEVEA